MRQGACEPNFGTDRPALEVSVPDVLSIAQPRQQAVPLQFHMKAPGEISSNGAILLAEQSVDILHPMHGVVCLIILSLAAEQRSTGMQPLQARYRADIAKAIHYLKARYMTLGWTC